MGFSSKATLSKYPLLELDDESPLCPWIQDDVRIYSPPQSSRNITYFTFQDLSPLHGTFCFAKINDDDYWILTAADGASYSIALNIGAVVPNIYG